MSSAARVRISVEEYLQRERVAEHKSEFYDGEVFAMAGASPVHNTIVANLIRVIGNGLLGSPCRVYPSDQRTRVPSGLYTYPDLVIACGKPEFAKEDANTLVNPTAVVEVLSPKTENYDTGKKFRWYKETPTIQEIIFVSQGEPRVQVFRRTEAGWLHDEAAAQDQSIQLRTGEVTLSLADVYLNVDWQAADGAASGEASSPTT